MEFVIGYEVYYVAFDRAVDRAVETFLDQGLACKQISTNSSCNVRTVLLMKVEDKYFKIGHQVAVQE